MTTPRLALAILAVWRLAILLTYEKTADRFRARLKVDYENEHGEPITLAGKILSCFWCTTLILSFLIVWIAYTPFWWVLLPLACSGGSIILYHAVRMHLYVER